MMKENTQEKDILPTSPALSFFTSSSDVTEVREFKRRCLRNRERNKTFEKEFAIQKKIYWAIKKINLFVKRAEYEKINTLTALHFPQFLLILQKQHRITYQNLLVRIPFPSTILNKMT